MREIKFRAWCQRYKCMFPNVLPFIDGAVIEIYDGDDGYDERIDCDFVVMQFTGVKDKNCKEIYEGDILENLIGERFEVLFKRGTYIIRPTWMKPGEFDIPLSACKEGTVPAVVGNIYENPELLEAADG